MCILVVHQAHETCARRSDAMADMQVLHFVPAMRRALLQHKPSPEADHSLADEAALLERMLSGV